MNELSELCITSTAESALKKLKKAEISVYNCKKQGAYFIFAVKDKDIKKAFAIFSKPCYNIAVRKKSARKTFLSRIFLRLGLVLGCLIFVFAAFISDFYILKVEVTGSGSYLKSEVTQIVSEEGAETGKPFSAFNSPVATGKILALPQVVFCNITKRGSVLVVDVQVEISHSQSVSGESLICDVDGTVENIVVICGTAAVSAGDAVSKGDVLIYPSMQVNERTESCVAVGYAEIKCSRTAEYIAPDSSEKSIKEAYATLLLEDMNILSRSHKILTTESGVRIVMYVEYLHKVNINLT